MHERNVTTTHHKGEPHRMTMHHDPYDGFEEEVLANGVSLFVQQRQHVPWNYVGFVMYVGAREDPGGRDGTAHLVEHLVSENVPGWTFPELETHFRSLGGYGNFGLVTPE